MEEPVQAQQAGTIASLASVIKGLTLSNVLVIFLLILTLAPAYLAYKVINDEHILDRLLSQYEELPTSSGCLLRHVQERGGADIWSIASGFALQGADRWFVSAVLPREPTPEEIVSYCESLKLLADRFSAGGNGVGH